MTWQQIADVFGVVQGETVLAAVQRAGLGEPTWNKKKAALLGRPTEIENSNKERMAEDFQCVQPALCEA
jgi:hypothetical protein